MITLDDLTQESEPARSPHDPADRPDRAPTGLRQYVRWGLAMLSLGCGRHPLRGDGLTTSTRRGTTAAFFAAMAWLQLAWAVAIVVKPTRRLLLAGIIGNLVIAEVWLVSRTIGIPIGPNSGESEPAAFADMLSTILEVGIVLGSLALLRPEVPRPPARAPRAALPGRRRVRCADRRARHLVAHARVRGPRPRRWREVPPVTGRRPPALAATPVATGGAAPRITPGAHQRVDHRRRHVGVRAVRHRGRGQQRPRPPWPGAVHAARPGRARSRSPSRWRVRTRSSPRTRPSPRPRRAAGAASPRTCRASPPTTSRARRSRIRSTPASPRSCSTTAPSPTARSSASATSSSPAPGKAPEGFAGANDPWHVHEYLCIGGAACSGTPTSPRRTARPAAASVRS